MKIARITLALSAGCLALAVTGVFSAGGSDKAFSGQKLAERLPREIGSWQGDDVPLGETEAVRAAVHRLNYDDYVYRVYRHEGREIFVYAMFWRQGQISVREMAGHTPDACWVANGARSVDPSIDRPQIGGDKWMLSGQSRCFQFPDASRVNVVWWHLWGEEFVPARLSERTFAALFWEVWIWLVHNRGRAKDQLFVRIHSREPLIALEETPVIRTFMELFPHVPNGRPAT